MVSLKELENQIAKERKKLQVEDNINAELTRKRKLQKELFLLKRRKLIGTGSKVKRLSKKFGQGLLNVGKKVTPVVKKQVRLIRDQQLRDDAIARERSKRAKKIKKPKKISKDTGIFGTLDF